MILLTASRFDSIVQLITVVLIFIFVLALACIATMLAAGVQKGKMMSPNVEVIETFKLAQNKYIQIVRIGEKYFSIVVCKDTVTLLGEIAKDDITIQESGLGKTLSFQEILNKAKNLNHKK